MRIAHVNCSEKSGGAAIAAYRLHKALVKDGTDSFMTVARSASGDLRTSSPNTLIAQFKYKLYGKLDSYICRILSSEKGKVHQSAGLFGSDALRRAQALKPDVLHLHWINGGCVSLSQLSAVQLPVVWTLHDTWPFGGLSHYENSHDSCWYQNADSSERAPRGGQLSVWAKRRSLPKGKLTIVAPSNWMAECARSSRVFQGVDVRVIPNCIDVEEWKPEDPVLSRTKLEIPIDANVILFSAAEGFSEQRKGGDLYIRLLRQLQQYGRRRVIALLVGVNSPPKELIDFCEARAFGFVSDVDYLRTLYSASDFVVIPSRLDNLPNVGLEAQACGTPVAAFGAAGLPDIVANGVNGVIAPPFQPETLAMRMLDVINDPQSLGTMRRNSRKLAVDRYSEPVVTKQYLEVYRACQ